MDIVVRRCHLPAVWSLQPAASFLRLLTLAVCCTAPTWLNAAEQPGEREFRAGAYAANITPPLGLPIVGGWEAKGATNVHDQLHARCLVLDDGRTKLAIVVCDNLGPPREIDDAARELIAEETDIPADNVLISGTHTHSAASLRGPKRLQPFDRDEMNEYQRFVVRRIADGVRCAVNNLEPAEIAWGAIDDARHVFNRRWIVLDEELARNPFGGIDKARMNPPRGSAALARPAGPVDPQVSFISVRSRDGQRPISLLANYSLHYVGGVRSGDYSADYFGMFADEIAQRLDAEGQEPPFVGIMSNGTSGDINNNDYSLKETERFEPYGKMRRVASQVADKVKEAHDELEWQQWVPLSAAAADLTLQVRQPSEEMLSYLRGIVAQGDSAQRLHQRELIYAERVEQVAAGPDELTIKLQAFRIGDLGIAAIPFEVFAEIGLEIKEKSPSPQTFTIELANGSYGYLPTPEQHEVGGYETWLGTNIVELEASRKITKKVLELMQQLDSAPRQ